VWLTVALVGLVGQWRQESREQVRGHRQRLDEHTRECVHQSQAFEQMLQDHRRAMGR
jgi:hypothetical protein